MSNITDTFRTEEPFLSTLLEEIDTGAMQLPDFQRSWVWDDERIRGLIASVTQGYPIGVLMGMETDENDTLSAPRLFTGVEKGSKSLSTLILDGQQRLTTLFLTLKYQQAVKTCNKQGKKIKYFYYLDIEKCLDNSNRFEAIIAVPEDKKIKRDFNRVVELDLSDPANEYEHSMFPLNSLLLNDRMLTWIDAYQEYYDFDRERIKLSREFQKRIAMPLQKYKIPIIILHKDTPKDAVCQVFENVNKGVALNVFELVTATYVKDNFTYAMTGRSGKKNFGKLIPFWGIIQKQIF